MADFYPLLFEKLDKVSKGGENTAIRKELVKRFPDKYEESKTTGSVKNKKRGAVTSHDLAKDIVDIIKTDTNWSVSEPEVRFEPKPIGLSGTFDTIFLDINGKQHKFVLRGEQNAVASKTPTSFKEGLVCFFAKSKKEYKAFSKSSGTQAAKKASYNDLMSSIYDEIEEDGIEGVTQKDKTEILDFLRPELNSYNLDILNSVFNAMSIGNWIRSSQFSDWEIRRDKFFSDIKTKIGKEIFGYSQTDKWNPMDIMLIRKGSQQEILDRISEAKQEENEQLQLGKINSLFIDKLDSTNENALILSISLKESKSQSGKAKGFLKKLKGDIKDKYNLTAEEKTWINDKPKLNAEIINLRNEILNIVNNTDLYEYLIIDGGVEDLHPNVNPLPKYTSLKMTLFLLNQSIYQKDLFVDMVKFGLSSEKNPTFFKFKGNPDGDYKKVEDLVETFPPNSGMQLYNTKTHEFDGKIKIIDTNKSQGMSVQYYIEFMGQIFEAYWHIRINNSNATSQATIELNKWRMVVDLNKINESEYYEDEGFYPILG